MVKKKTGRPFGFVRYRAGRPSPHLAGFNPPEGGKEVTQAFATEADADIWLAEQHVSIARSAFINPNGAKTLFGDYWCAWLAERRLRPTSKETYQSHGRSYILPVFGPRQLGSIRRNEVQSWVNRLPVGARTAQTVLAVLQSCLKAAVLDGLITKSVAVGVEPPEISRRPFTMPTTEEIEALTGAMYGRYRVAVHLAAYTGLRQGEVLGLRVEDLDMLGRRLNVARQAQTLRGGVRLDLPPKSDAGHRRVPLAPETLEVIAAHLATYPARQGLVVATGAGRPVRRNMFGEQWEKAKVRAGVTRPLRFHDLRHFYASLLIEAGLDALTVKTLMGHSSVDETFGTYGHMFPDQSERAAAAVTSALQPRRSRTKPRTARDESAGRDA